MTDRIQHIDDALSLIEIARDKDRVATHAFSLWLDGKVGRHAFTKADALRSEALQDAARAVRDVLNLEPWVSPISPDVEHALVRARTYLLSQRNGTVVHEKLTGEKRRLLKRMIDQAVRDKNGGVRKTSGAQVNFEGTFDGYAFAAPVAFPGDWIPFGRGGELTDRITADLDLRMKWDRLLRRYPSDEIVYGHRRYYDEKPGSRHYWRTRVGYDDPEPLV